MFKKTLLALTVVGMSSTAMGAITVADATLKPTPQRVTTDGAYTSSAITATVNANYAAGDTLSIVLSHDVDATQVFATTAVASTSCTGGGDSMSVTYAGYDAATKTATYTVNAATAVTLGCVIPVPGIIFDGAVIAAADKVTASLSTSKGFGTLESTATPYELFDVAATQYTVTVAAGTEADGATLNAVIDVSNGRYQFTPVASDSVTLGLVNAGTAAALYSQLEATSTMTVSGDFSWAAVTAADGTVTYPGVTVADGTGTKGAVTTTASSVSWVATTAGTYLLTLAPQAASKAIVLPKTTYTLTTNVAYKKVAGGAEAVLSEAITSAAGAWTLNGANITAYGIPNGGTVDPFLWVSNTGAAEGAITVDVTCDGVTTTGIDGGTATGKTNTRIAGLVQAAVDAAGTCAATSRYDAAVTVNAPVANITVAAGYKVTAADGATDRVALETSDSLDGFGS